MIIALHVAFGESYFNKKYDMAIRILLYIIPFFWRVRESDVGNLQVATIEINCKECAFPLME